MRIVLGSLCAVILALVLVTLVALEGREVVVLRTFDAEGKVRTTRTWIADHDGYMWVEAANPQRPFLAQLRSIPQLELQRGGRLYQCMAVLAANPGGHEQIRRLLAAKYTWADGWIALLTDTSASVAVRLQCR